MEGTILHKLLKWIVASSVSLLAIPISVFIIIFSLYPDLVEVNYKDLNKLKGYYDLCDTLVSEKEIIKKNPNLLPFDIDQENINKNHLLVIDQTLSTVFEDNQLDSLKKYLKLSLRNTTNSDSLKTLVYEKIIESYIVNYNCDSLLVYFYNGSKISLNPSWIKITSNGNYFSPRILQYINHSVKIVGQETDFRVIFKTVSDLIKTNKLDCITFLSDFYHEPELDLYNSDFYCLKKASKDIKINLIALWRTTYTGKDSARIVQRQNNFIAKFNKYYLGVVGTEKLFIDKYQNSLFTHYGDFLEFEEIISFRPNPYEVDIDTTAPTIRFYSPINNSLNYHVAKAIIKIDTVKKFNWKLKSIFEKNNAFVLFNPDCDTSNVNRCILNQWYEDKCDSLLLSVRLDQNLNFDDLKFCYIVEKNGINIFNECNIEIKKIKYPDEFRKYLLKVLNISIALLIICIISIELLIAINLFNDEN